MAKAGREDVVADMMRKYNKEKAIVFNTLQMYRWDRLDYLKKLNDQAKAEGFHIGMKLVRGAYMEKENARALERGLKSPICVSKEATDINYDAAVFYMVEHLDHMAIFAGTHNEESWMQDAADAIVADMMHKYRDWETDRKSTRLNSSHRL